MKYKCLDCNQSFEGDRSTTNCPNCNSTNIQRQKLQKVVKHDESAPSEPAAPVAEEPQQTVAPVPEVENTPAPQPEAEQPAPEAPVEEAPVQPAPEPEQEPEQEPESAPAPVPEPAPVKDTPKEEPKAEPAKPEKKEEKKAEKPAPKKEDKAPKKKNLLWLWITLGAVGVLAIVGVVLFLVLGNASHTISATLTEKGGTILIEVSGERPSTLKSDFKVIVYDDNNNVHAPIFFNGSESRVRYSTTNLLEGGCYTFNVERKDGKYIKDLIWTTTNRYCVPVTEPVQVVETIDTVPAPVIVKPEIERITNGVPNSQKGVWNKVVVIMKDTTVSYTYTIGDITQKSPEFNGLKPGNYTVTVETEDGYSTTAPLLLNSIKKLDAPLTVAEVQAIFDKVSDGSMSASVAQNKLAVGNVNLATVIEPDIRTLWGALMEAAMGEKFQVVSFTNDPNTNKIKSGTLKLSRV